MKQLVLQNVFLILVLMGLPGPFFSLNFALGPKMGSVFSGAKTLQTLASAGWVRFHLEDAPKRPQLRSTKRKRPILMLGQGCLRALFWRTIDLHLKWV